MSSNKQPAKSKLGPKNLFTPTFDQIISGDFEWTDETRNVLLNTPLENFQTTTEDYDISTKTSKSEEEIMKIVRSGCEEIKESRKRNGFDDYKRMYSKSQKACSVKEHVNRHSFVVPPEDIFWEKYSKTEKNPKAKKRGTIILNRDQVAYLQKLDLFHTIMTTFTILETNEKNDTIKKISDFIFQKTNKFKIVSLHKCGKSENSLWISVCLDPSIKTCYAAILCEFTQEEKSMTGFDYPKQNLFSESNVILFSNKSGVLGDFMDLKLKVLGFFFYFCDCVVSFEN